MPFDKWQNVSGINLTGAFLFAQSVGREMLKRQYGRIINVSSVSGLELRNRANHCGGWGTHYRLNGERDDEQSASAGPRRG
ncbi:MAG: SDR family NAD(P)-dependent oxidoreductase [Acidobacteriota bacterium]|nr:SDR family NAD(P)-dependent oxidoreductase [Acidobacteriota bacterium]